MAAMSSAERVIEEFIWSPQPGPQYALFECDIPEVFFGGSRGGGKTDGVLGKWAAKEEDFGEDFNAIMFRRTTVSSADAIDRSKQIFGQLGGKFNETKLTWRMPHGGRVAFAYLDSADDAQEYQGRNVTDAWIEEAGQYPSPDPIFRLFGALRGPIPIQMILTGNPGGPGQGWIRDRYEMVPFPTRPRVLLKPLPDGSMHQVAVIPSRLSDNRILMRADPTYVNRLQLVGNGALVRAWLDGDWNAIEGAFFDEWSEAKHVVAPFTVPADWLRLRSMDWGSASPFSVGWWAVVSDDYRLADGRVVPRGALVRYREWYGATTPNSADSRRVGLKLTAEEIAKGIVKASGEEKFAYSVLDTSAFDEDGGPSLAERMQDEGRRLKSDISFVRSNKKRTSDPGIMGGWDMMRHRLRGGADGVPMLYVFSTCRDFIRTIPGLQHDPHNAEDLDSDMEDHIADETRYACMSRPWIPSPPKPDPVKSTGYERTGGKPEKSWRV